MLQTVSLLMLIAITTPSIAMLPSNPAGKKTTELRSQQLINRLEEITSLLHLIE